MGHIPYSELGLHSDSTGSGIQAGATQEMCDSSSEKRRPFEECQWN